MQSQLDFDAWCDDRCANSVQFQYWFICYKLQIILLVFVRSIREGNFTLFVETLKQMIPWFFSLDHVHYARWLPIHLMDMLELETHNLEVHRHFMKGRFVVHKTNHKFSAISSDQAHEQNNAIVKGVGGAVGLLTDTAAIRRWLVSGPEISHFVDSFEHRIMRKSTGSDKHHEHYASFQQREHTEIQSLKHKFVECGNPFMADGHELFHITKRTVAAQSVTITVRSIQELGDKQFTEYVY